MSDARKRWKELHRARRVLKRSLATMGDKLCDPLIPVAYRMQMVDLIVNPPHVYDPELPGA